MDHPGIDALSEYLDNELSARERAAVDAHLPTCVECRRTLADLGRIVETARALRPRPPVRDLWDGIAERLDAANAIDDGVVAVPENGAARGATFRPTVRRISFTLPQLAAASLLLAAVTGGLAWGLRAPGAFSSRGTPPAVVANGPVQPGSDPGVDLDARDQRSVARPAATQVSFADAQYDAAVADLEKALDHGRGRLDKTTIAVVEQNLQIIDHAIAQARQALDADPANTYLSSHLVETRRRKLDLLRRAAALAN